MSHTRDLLTWLRSVCNDYQFAPRAVYRRGLRERWPLQASSEDDLETALAERGHLMPLPKEPASLANVIEVSILDFLVEHLSREEGAEPRRGGERGYPDLEVKGPRFGDGIHAVDIKVARRAESGRRTNSRITLYTGNTYFMYPELPWSLTLRPFGDYESHLDLVVLYDFEPEKLSRLANVELIIHEGWRLASRQRSSTTREYIGAVTSIEDLRAGKGEFDSEEEFYSYWRSYPFKIGKAVKQQLQKLLKEQGNQGSS